LPLPIQLDGVEISAVAPFAAIVSQTLANPPFLAPGFRSSSFWVQRLYRLLPTAAQQAAVGQAVAAQLSSADPRTARAALDFFCDAPAAPGGEQIAVIADRDRDRLRATPDPRSSTTSLHDRMLEAINARLVIVQCGLAVDQAALEVARRALLAGEAGDGTLFRIAKVDATWYCEHVADIVRARPKDIEYALEALTRVRPPERTLALGKIQGLGKAASCAVSTWISEHPELFDQG
jgi:hypothetical protein